MRPVDVGEAREVDEVSDELDLLFDHHSENVMAVALATATSMWLYGWQIEDGDKIDQHETAKVREEKLTEFVALVRQLVVKHEQRDKTS